MRRLPTPCIARMRVISRKALLNTAVYRLQPSSWKTRSDSRKRTKTQPNRLLIPAYYWQNERRRRRLILKSRSSNASESSVKINSNRSNAPHARNQSRGLLLGPAVCRHQRKGRRKDPKSLQI